MDDIFKYSCDEAIERELWEATAADGLEDEWDYAFSNIDVPDDITKFNQSAQEVENEAYNAYMKGYISEELFRKVVPIQEEGSKNDDGLVQFDAIPPLGEFELAKAFTIGSKKYDNHNFRKGFKYGRMYSAMMRHAKKWLAGEQRDPKDGQHHLASVAWYALVLIEQEHRHPELDDRFKMDEDYIRKLHDMRG